MGKMEFISLVGEANLIGRFACNVALVTIDKKLLTHQGGLQSLNTLNVV